MANCSDNTYVLKHTDNRKYNIIVRKSALVTSEYDIALVGKTRLEYGEIFNENVLHLLENFSCPEDPASTTSNVTPNFSEAYGLLLENPTEGQVWYNSTKELPYTFDGNKWLPLMARDDVAGNRGVIEDGETLPIPLSTSGYVFSLDECSWIVTPFHYPNNIDFMECYTDSNATVTVKYRVTGDSELTSGLANYQIIAIRGNDSLGAIPTPPIEP